MKKTVLITGASSGFGKETALLFHQKGWNVIASMRSPEKEEELTRLDNVLVTRLDVQDTDSIQSAVREGLEKFGSIDVLINNAGYALMGIFESATEEQIRNQFDVNVFGMMRTTRAVLPVMRKNGRGAIVNISSVAGVVGLPFASLYESSKFAVEGFSEALSHELFKLNIKVKIVEPGAAQTNFGNAREGVKNEIEDYNPYMAKFFENYPEKTAHTVITTCEQVAITVYDAATDESERLRYVIGGDAQFFIDTKLKNSEEKYLETVREFFH